MANELKRIRVSSVYLFSKIKSIIMQTGRLLQAVAIMLIVALAASCTATKQYTSKLFAPRNPAEEARDTTAVALRFLDLDNVEPNKEDWVTTDIIMGRDSSARTTALDNFSKVFPSTAAKKDSASALPVKDKDADARPAPIMTTTKPVEEPMARTYNTGETRTKKSRDDK
jgi:hypothetical protein